MRENRERWLDLLLSPQIEGGYSNLGWDPETNHGVTKATLEQWRKKPVTTEDMKALTADEARAVMTGMFWNVVQGDQLPGGLDAYLADFAVNSGPPRAVRKLQEIVGVKVDGWMGEKTLAACRAWPDTRDLVEELHRSRMAFLRSLPKWEMAGRGWTDRCARMRELALSLVQPNIVEAKAPQAAVKSGLLSLLAVLIASLPTFWPQLVPHVTGAQQAAAAKDWAALSGYVFSGLAVAVPALIGAWMTYRSHQRAAK